MSKNLFLEEQEESLSAQNTGLSMELNSLLTSNKAEITEKISDALQVVENGNIDPLDALIYAKKLEYISKELLAGLKGKAEISGSKFSRHNADIVEQMMGVKYDCSNCNDPEYDAFILQLTPLLEKKKEIEKRLKAVTKPYDVIDPNTGEVLYTIMPPVKYGSLSLKLTLK